MQQKCVFIAYSINSSSVSDYFTELSNKFYSFGYKVIVLSDKKSYENQLNKNIIIKYWPSKRPTKFKDFLFIIRLIFMHKPQLMISIFGSVNIFLITGFLLGIKHRIAWIRTLSTQFSQKKHLILRKSIIYKLSTNVISNSDATKTDAAQTYKIPLNKIQVLQNSVKDYYENINNIPKHYSTIIYAGRLHESKGVDVLIKALRIIKSEGIIFKLYIIGQGPNEDFLKNYTLDLELQEDITFLGFLSKPEVLQWFSSSGVAVVPSYSEAFGFTVIEAMSVKTCVIGANNTGIKEIIIHNETGLLFETGNAIDLAVHLKKVLTNQEFCDKLAFQGYMRFKSNYETQKAINRDFEFFNQLLK
jgi:glycosyltransferase involved in cell wall biosynthesis